MNWDDGNAPILAPHYHRALNIIFRIENALRLVVYVVLKTKYEDKWCEVSIDTDDATAGTIASIAKRRAAQDDACGHLGVPVACPLMFLTSGELIRLITSNSHWRLFKSLFPMKRELVSLKLEEIGNIRNSLAHSRPLAPDDVAAVQSNAHQILGKCEEILAELWRQHLPLPSNMEEVWKGAIANNANDLCRVELLVSSQNRFVELRVEIDMAFIATDHADYTFSYIGHKLLAINIPQCFPRLASLMICIREKAIGNLYWEEKRKPRVNRVDDSSYSKLICMTFAKTTIESSWQVISTELDEMLNRIQGEIQMLRSDPGARGELVEVCKGSAHIESEGKTYQYQVDAGWANCKVTNVGPIEFWGDRDYESDDFISHRTAWPWMPNAVFEYGSNGSMWS